VRGSVSQSDAMAIPEVAAEVREVLGETSRLLVAKHGLDPDEQERYLRKNLTRFANPSLADTVERVGRQPLRKLSRHERFVGPAAELADRGLPFDALVRAMAAALRFDVPEDAQSVELRELLASASPEEFVRTVTGVPEGSPLFGALFRVVSEAQGAESTER
jgi:mannitol-1-phosphate 5-dehydrogenase